MLVKEQEDNGEIGSTKKSSNKQLWKKNIIVAREQPKRGVYFLDQRRSKAYNFEAQITLFLIA